MTTEHETQDQTKSAGARPKFRAWLVQDTPEGEAHWTELSGLWPTKSGTGFKGALRTPLVNMRPDGGGRFLLRSNELDRLLASDEGALPSHPQAQELMRRAARTVPALKHVEVEAVRIATRPIPKDSYSAVGPVPGLSGYYAVVSHSGVTLGAFLGELVADELVHGRERGELAEFRPSRFFN